MFGDFLKVTFWQMQTLIYTFSRTEFSHFKKNKNPLISELYHSAYYYSPAYYLW